jgi:hypothetical protein
MTTLIVCDHCGEKTSDHILNVEVWVAHNKKHYYHICSNCSRDFYAFLKYRVD